MEASQLGHCSRAKRHHPAAAVQKDEEIYPNPDHFHGFCFASVMARCNRAPSNFFVYRTPGFRLWARRVFCLIYASANHSRPSFLIIPSRLSTSLGPYIYRCCYLRYQIRGVSKVTGHRVAISSITHPWESKRG